MKNPPLYSLLYLSIQRNEGVREIKIRILHSDNNTYEAITLIVNRYSNYLALDSALYS